MKKIPTLFFALSLLLTSCSGQEEVSEQTEEPRFYTYKTAEFEMEVPETWETLSSFTSEYPDELRVAFRNNIKEGDFVANVTVVRESNEANLTNADFAQEKLEDHAATLVNYELLEQEQLTLLVSGNESSTFLNTFQGKNETASKTLEFKQLTLVKGDKAWVVTASYLPLEDEFVIARMDKMLRSFNLK